MHQQTRHRKADPDLRNITVVGSGTMGHGIAQAAAVAGYDTILNDTNEAVVTAGLDRIRFNLDGAVQRGKIKQADADDALARISLEVDLAEAVSKADLVIEAIVENLHVKKELFQKLSAHAPRDAFLTTNTSSLSVGEIAMASGRAEKVAGMHFFNPVHIMKLVELVTHSTTSDECLEAVREVALTMGKEPIIVKDTPGFASSRLGVVLGLEAMRMVEQGVAEPEDIDKALELGYGHPMGPLKVSDLVGLDIRLAIAEYLYRELKDDQYKPPQILKNKVDAGALGKKVGKGFYEWPNTKTS